MLATLALGAYFAAALRWPMGIDADPANGFEVWRSMQRGAAFNHLIEPDSADISRDQEVFLSWWTPGQYLVPGVVATLLGGRPLGVASLLVVLVAMTAATAGWYRLYLAFGFSAGIAAVSVAVLVLSPTVARAFAAYDGGTGLLLGWAPWVLLLALRSGNDTWPRSALLVLAFLIGFFLKNAFLTAALATCAALALLGVDRREASPGERAVPVLRAGAVFAITLWIAHVTYLSGGSNPAQLHGFATHVPRALLFPLAGPLLGATSVGTALERVAGLGWHLDPTLLLPLAALSLVYLFAALRGAPDRRYRIFALAAFATYAVVHTYFYLGASLVGYLGRYYRVAGLLLLPGALATVGRWPRPVRWACWAALVGLCLGGPYLAVEKARLRQSGAVGVEGFTLATTESVLEALQRLDAGWPEHTALIHLGDPTWSLEVRRQRWLVGPAWHSKPERIRKRVKHGRPGALYVVVPLSMEADGRAAAILESYADVPGWTEIRLDGGVIYHPSDQEARVPAWEG